MLINRATQLCHYYSTRSRFSIIFSCLISCRLGAACGCRRLCAAFVCYCHDAVFICVRAIQTSKICPISDNKSNQWSSIYCKTEIIGILVIIVILNV